MSPKRPFNVMLEPEQIEALRAIELATGAKPSEQIRRAIDRWIQENRPPVAPAPRRRGPQARGRGR
jgi:hypothetical protein